MLRAKPITGFLVRFVLVFGVLAAPWPGWKEGCGNFFRGEARLIFGSIGSKGVARFRPNPSPEPRLDTLVLIGNRDTIDSAGHGNAAHFEFNTRSLVCLPMMLVIALVLASPVPWKRRMGALLWGVLLGQAFFLMLIALILLSMIGANPWLGLVGINSFWRAVLGGLHDVFLTHLGGRLAVAVIIWLLVTFRRGDWARLIAEPQAAGDGRKK